MNYSDNVAVEETTPHKVSCGHNLEELTVADFDDLNLPVLTNIVEPT